MNYSGSFNLIYFHRNSIKASCNLLHKIFRLKSRIFQYHLLDSSSFIRIVITFCSSLSFTWLHSSRPFLIFLFSFSAENNNFNLRNVRESFSRLFRSEHFGSCLESEMKSSRMLGFMWENVMETRGKSKVWDEFSRKLWMKFEFSRSMDWSSDLPEAFKLIKLSNSAINLRKFV